MKRFVCIGILLIFFFPGNKNSFAKEEENFSLFKYTHFNSLLYASVGFAFGFNSVGFFNEYHSIIKGKQTEFRFSPLLTTGYKLRIGDKYHFGINVEYVKAQMSEDVSENYIDYGITYSRLLLEKIQVYSLPVFISGEYIPYNTQFRTYTGGGLGLVVSSIQWDEFIASSNINEPRKGGQMFNENTIYPAIKIYTGVELGFDKHESDFFLGSFYLEVSFNYFIRRTRIFSKIKEQLDSKTDNMESVFAIIPGYIGLNFGISLATPK
ncbi:MAG: hypothetical protein WCT77_09535 [Bacteroidota bacterium]|jgi:hypothetical protein